MKPVLEEDRPNASLLILLLLLQLLELVVVGCVFPITANMHLMTVAEHPGVRLPASPHLEPRQPTTVGHRGLHLGLDVQMDGVRKMHSKNAKKGSRQSEANRLRIPKRDDDNVTKPSNRKDEKNRKEDERKKSPMKETDKLRKWDPGWRNQTRVQIMGASNLVVNWVNGRWNINNQKFRAEVQKTQNLLDKRDIRPMSDHMVLFQHICRDWNEKADRLTHEAREKGSRWNSFSMHEGEKLEAASAFFGGGVSNQDDHRAQYKVGSGHVHQTSERIEEDVLENNCRSGKDPS